jgi:low affinity Fe/Cu permease
VQVPHGPFARSGRGYFGWALNPVSFARVASLASQWSGTAWAFLGAVAVVLAWLASGPLFRFSDTWQLVINTGTTVVTFLMVFLIQNTQNRDAAAAQLKLDELIRASDRAHSRLIAIEKRGTE